MSEIGYYRYKTTADAEKEIVFGVNGVNAGSKTVVPVDGCPDDQIIKYLDKNGQYRFWSFNRFYRTSDSPDLIGQVNKFVTDIQNDQSARQNVGYRSERKIDLYSEATREQLEKLSDLYTSPRVYLYIGSNNSDTTADWLEVTAEAFEGIVRPSKKNLINFNITVTLPEQYNITML